MSKSKVYTIYKNRAMCVLDIVCAMAVSFGSNCHQIDVLHKSPIQTCTKNFIFELSLIQIYANFRYTRNQAINTQMNDVLFAVRVLQFYFFLWPFDQCASIGRLHVARFESNVHFLIHIIIQIRIFR